MVCLAFEVCCLVFRFPGFLGLGFFVFGVCVLCLFGFVFPGCMLDCFVLCYLYCFKRLLPI